MSWCLVIPAVLVTLLAIAALVAPSQAFWSTHNRICCAAALQPSC
jgi:hypothetical protein